MPPNTAMYLYKMDKVVSVVRDVKFTNELELGVDGKVNRGNVLVEVFFEIPPSFQSGTGGTKPKLIYSEEFYEGQRLNISEYLKKGKGRYTVRFTYVDATGSFQLKLPGKNEL